MLVNDLQPSNADSPIEVTLSGIVTLANDSQPSNARSPIEVTPSGITMLVSDLQPWNAQLSIEVTPSGITTLVMFLFFINFLSDSEISIESYSKSHPYLSSFHLFYQQRLLRHIQ